MPTYYQQPQQWPNNAYPQAIPQYTYGAPQYMAPQPSQNQMIQMIPVDSIDEVMAVQVNTPTYFFDKKLPVFYQRDMTGVRIFDYVERGKQTENEKPVTRAEFEELKKLIDELTK